MNEKERENIYNKLGPQARANINYNRKLLRRTKNPNKRYYEVLDIIVTTACFGFLIFALQFPYNLIPLAMWAYVLKD